MRKYIRRRAEPRHALTLRVRCLRKVRLHDDEIAAGHAHKLVNDALFHTTIRLDSMHRDDATATVAGHRNVVQLGSEIGRASGRGSVCQYVEETGVAVSVKKKNNEETRVKKM